MLGLSPHARAVDGAPVGSAVTVAQSQICVGADLTILIRRGDKYGALRFSQVVARSESGSGSAHYESIFQGDGSGALQKGTATRRTGKVETKPLVGIGRVAVQTGNTSIRVGPFRFRYDYPGCVSMEQVGKEEGDEGFRFSAVRAAQPSEADVHAADIRWFGYERNRRVTFYVP
jgi:hypothetical protein